jgi:ribonuclease HI
VSLAKTEFGIVIFCDGACSGNPGPGGWGSIIATPEGEVREIGGRADSTTNNQMELAATIEALRAIDTLSGDATVYTDSVYVIRGITQWIWGWMRNGWRTAEGKDVLNKEYWQTLSNIVGNRKKNGRATEWKHVRGHMGIPGNERVDEIAVAFSKGYKMTLYRGPLLGYDIPIFDLPPDEGLPEMRQKAEKKAAHSYLSLIGNTPMRHLTWAECERRVKGQPGARFKKTASTSDELDILKSWGVDPKNLKS